MQNTQFTTQKNNLNICCIVLSQYDKEIIQRLKNHNFRYYSKTKQWQKSGFTDLQLFEFYCIAVINNDTKTIKKLEPKKEDLKADIIKLATIKRQSKKEYIQKKNNEKIDEITALFDKGTGEIICQYCIENKLNFWTITKDEIIKLLLENNNILTDILDFNNSNNIQTSKYILDIYNEGLPF